MSFPNLVLQKFSTVTLVPVLYRGRKEHELRLYIPKRVQIEELRAWTDAAQFVFGHTINPTPSPRITTLEYNQHGMCFNSFVTPTTELIAAVNDARKLNGLKPVRL